MEEKLKFPEFNPRRRARDKLSAVEHFNYLSTEQRKEIFKALRNVAGGFIAKKAVRDFIFTRDGNKCKNCGATEGLQIDHVISVYACFHGEIPVEKLNNEENLQTLCRKCNCSKTP